MPGALAHSPADVLRRLLISLSLGSDPTQTSPPDWSIYVGAEPDSPDSCITLFDTEGVQHGRTSPDNERQEWHGVQIRVRGATHPTGYAKARAVAVALDNQVECEEFTFSGSTYRVHGVVRTSDVVAIGQDRPASRRQVFTVNALAHVRQTA